MTKGGTEREGYSREGVRQAVEVGTRCRSWVVASFAVLRQWWGAISVRGRLLFVGEGSALSSVGEGIIVHGWAVIVRG
jgi:hypothetical protein